MGSLSHTMTFMHEVKMLNVYFKKKDLGTLNWRIVFGHNPSRFISNYHHYLSFRIVLLLSITITIILTILEFYSFEPSTFYWFIYLTNWGLIIEFLYLSLAVYTTYRSKKFHHTQTSELPLFVQVMWCCYVIILPSSFMIFAMYWLLVYNGRFTLNCVLCHGLNFMVMALDTLFGSQPYLLLHGIYFATLGLVFLAWSYVHFLFGIGNEQDNGNYIYPYLDWQNPQKCIYLALGLLFIVTPVVNFIFWMIVNQRNECYKYRKARSDDMNVSSMDTKTDAIKVDAEAFAM